MGGEQNLIGWKELRRIYLSLLLNENVSVLEFGEFYDPGTETSTPGPVVSSGL